MSERATKEGQRIASNDVVEATTRIACRLFLERGYDNTPMSLIGKELGFTKAGIYHHFESKEHLLYVVHRTNIERMLLPIIEESEREADSEVRLRRFITGYSRLLTRDPSIRVMISEARRLSPEHLAEIEAVWRRAFDLVRDALCKLKDKGRCRSDLDPTYAAFAAIGMCSWIAYWFDYTRPQSGDAVARTMADIFLAGVLVESPAKHD